MVYDFKKNPTPNRQEPFPIYKKGCDSVKVFAVDFPGWQLQGWSDDESVLIEPEECAIAPSSESPEESELSPYELRKAELEGLLKQSWRKLSAIAEPLGISKPEGGWDEAIALILEAEGLEE